MSQLAATVAAELGFTGERLGRMRLAGLLHDVGKIGVPDAILNKPATDRREYAVMQHHALLGADIVRAADLAARRAGSATTTSATTAAATPTACAATASRSSRGSSSSPTRSRR